VTLDEIARWTRATVDAELARRLATPEGADDPGRLREAMRYAVLGGGKRLRPIVAVGACVAVGGVRERALPAALAVELLHAYTLVHDDLPAMDNDSLRRGMPTVHVAFGHAEAILAGDALLTAAFGALAPLGGDAVAVLAERAGVAWLLGGQARDIAPRKPETLEELERVHAGKTGALFSAAAELGAIAAGAGAEARTRLARFGMVLGIAFQHADDLDDGDHPGLAHQAERRLADLHDGMLQLLAPLGAAGGALAELAGRIART
jgi:geranylgeranyl pyrophosphate synthase